MAGFFLVVSKVQVYLTQNPDKLPDMPLFYARYDIDGIWIDKLITNDITLK